MDPDTDPIPNTDPDPGEPNQYGSMRIRIQNTYMRGPSHWVPFTKFGSLLTIPKEIFDSHLAFSSVM
jgi:hypothetical protein